MSQHLLSASAVEKVQQLQSGTEAVTLMSYLPLLTTSLAPLHLIVTLLWRAQTLLNIPDRWFCDASFSRTAAAREQPPETKSFPGLGPLCSCTGLVKHFAVKVWGRAWAVSVWPLGAKAAVGLGGRGRSACCRSSPQGCSRPAGPLSRAAAGLSGNGRECRGHPPLAAPPESSGPATGRLMCRWPSCPWLRRSDIWTAGQQHPALQVGGQQRAVLVPGSPEAWGLHLTAHPWRCRGWSRRWTPHHGPLHLQRRHLRHLHARQAVSVSAAAVQAWGCISCLSCQVRMQEHRLDPLDHHTYASSAQASGD